MTINAIPNGKAAQNRRENTSRGALSLRNRLLITFILLAALPVLLTGIVSVSLNSQGFRTAAFSQLEAVAQLKSNEITSWISTLQTNLGIIMQDRTSLTHASRVLKNSSDAIAAKVILRSKFNEFIRSTGYFEEIFIMDTSGTALLSTNRGQEGKIFANQSFFHEGIKGPYVETPSYNVSLSAYSIIFSRPIYARNGDLIGVIAGRANLEVLDNIMVQTTGLGNTGETYLIGSNYALLSTLRNENLKAGETYIRTTGTTNAITSKGSGTGVYNDYSNVPVLGAYLWIPELQISLIAEGDENEVLLASNRVFNITLGLMALSVIFAAVIAFFVTRSIVNPVSELVTIAQSVAAGNLENTAHIRNKDEIGTLAAAFNTMTSRLRELISTLEQRVTDRTKALATSTEVSRRLSTILDQKELFSEVVNQVKDAFGYYHAHIYLYDESNEELVMAGGTGEAGAEMLARGHKISKGQGLVGRAAESNEPVLVSDTEHEPNWLPNPLLPETKSEAAIPIAIGNQIIGVLDVQHNIVDGLKDEDISSLQSIANQAAVALQNIRQYENSRKIANDLSVVANVGIATASITNIDELLQQVVDLSKKSFNLYHAHIYMMNESGDTLQLAAGAGEVGKKMVAEGRSIPVDSEQSLVARAARSQSGVLVNDVTADPNFLPNPLLPDTRSELAAPMIANNKVIGVLDVQSETIGRFTDVDVNIKTTLASQIAVAVQNARSFAQSRRLAEREASVNVIAQKIQSATTVETALQIAARELGHALGMKRTRVEIDPTAMTTKTKGDSNE